VNISVVQLGRVDYATALRLQQTLVEYRKAGRIGDVLLLLEHTPVITLGRNARAQHVVAPQEALAAKGVELFECDRGGDVTYHGPGQLVGYPIFDLRAFTPRIGAVEFVRRLEEVLVCTCADMGIAAERVPGLTGVWTKSDSPGRHEGTESLRQAAKIAAIGVHISRGVTSHGFALNVATDLDYFNLIVPCGIADKAVTSMAREVEASGRAAPSLHEVAEPVTRNFGRVFNRQIVWVDTLDALLGRAVGVPMSPPRELREMLEDESFRA
jgi:lipoyl(octanoyl) transferase